MNLTRPVTVPEWVVLAALRYALPRRSYVVQDTIEVLRERWDDLSPKARRLVRLELEDELNYLESLPESAKRERASEIYRWRTFLTEVTAREEARTHERRDNALTVGGEAP